MREREIVLFEEGRKGVLLLPSGALSPQMFVGSIMAAGRPFSRYNILSLDWMGSCLESD